MNLLSHNLGQLLANRVATGLRQQSITSVSEWAQEYRVMGGGAFPGPWTETYHPWLTGIMDCEAEHQCSQKAAQMGVTEAALNKTFAAMDIHGDSVLYVLPASTPDASDFSSARFDPALEASSHLAAMFSDVKNVGHKRAGSANLFIRGSRSRSQLKSVPVSLAILDEIDEMVQENVAMIPERMSGQNRKQQFDLSTPTIENYGINKIFKISNQNHFFFKCPHCSRHTEFSSLEECLVITAEVITDTAILDSHYICKECKHPLDQADKINFLSTAEWVPQFADRRIIGHYINQMYSMTIQPYHIAEAVLKAQQSEAEEQELFNSKLGLPHATSGSKITHAMLENCKATHMQRNYALNSQAFLTMGIDVGKVLHYEIAEWVESPSGLVPRIIKEGKVKDFIDVARFMHSLPIRFCVIDAQPERRKSKEFAQAFPGRVLTCFYSNGATGKEVNVNWDELTVSVDRTSWLDKALGRFKEGSILLPRDLCLEYGDHLQNIVRVIKKNKLGNPEATYLNAGPDHLAHARNYNEIAFGLATTYGGSHNIGEEH